jgi:glutamate 5-kinase
VLLTKETMDNRDPYLKLRKYVETLLELGVVAVF